MNATCFTNECSMLYNKKETQKTSIKLNGFNITLDTYSNTQQYTKTQKANLNTNVLPVLPTQNTHKLNVKRNQQSIICNNCSLFICVCISAVHLWYIVPYSSVLMTFSLIFQTIIIVQTYVVHQRSWSINQGLHQGQTVVKCKCASR